MRKENFADSTNLYCKSLLHSLKPALNFAEVFSSHLKTLKIFGRSLVLADVLMKFAELEYNGASNRSLAKAGVAVGIKALTIATGGIGGVVVGVALNALDTYGGFDGFYQQFSNDP